VQEVDRINGMQVKKDRSVCIYIRVKYVGVLSITRDDKRKQDTLVC